MSVDVVVCTYNSEKHFEECLNSIYANVPVKTLFVIDKYSKDRTTEIAKRFNAFIIQTDCSLAEARALSFRVAKTPMLVSVDSDVTLCEDWFNKIMKYWDAPKIGAVCGISMDTDGLYGLYQKVMYETRDPTRLPITHMPDIVLRKEIVEDIEFPKCLDAGSVAHEDWWIWHWIERKGYKIITAPIYVKHKHTVDRFDRKTYWYGAGCRVVGRAGFVTMLFHVLKGIPKGVLVMLKGKEPKALPFIVRYGWREFVGWLKWNKYVDLKR